MAPKQILSDLWCHFGVPKSLKFEQEFDKKMFRLGSTILSLLEASGSGLGVDLRLVLGSILGSRAP